MKVLLVEPTIPKSWGSNQQFIGLLKVGAYHRARGDQVEYVKGCVLPAAAPDLICVTSMFTYQYKHVWKAVKFYKSMYPHAKVQLGGIYATLCPDHAQQSGADEIIVGQHPEAKDYPPDPTLLNPAPNFVYCMTSYGCSGSCTFCATHILYGQGIKQRSVRDVIAEIKLQVKRRFKNIYFGDDDIGYNCQNHLMPILEALVKKRIKVNLYLYGGMQSRSVTPEMAQLMKRARFKKVSLAIESTNQQVLKRMGRKRLGGTGTLQDAITNLAEAGFNKKDITVFFIIGLPYQKLHDIIETLAYLIKLGVWAQPQRWTPIPGTVDFKQLHLEKYDLEDLHYKTFVCPDQTEFTHGDLEAVYKIARFFNIGRLYSNYDFLDGNTRANEQFLGKLRRILSSHVDSQESTARG